MINEQCEAFANRAEAIKNNISTLINDMQIAKKETELKYGTGDDHEIGGTEGEDVWTQLDCSIESLQGIFEMGGLDDVIKRMRGKNKRSKKNAIPNIAHTFLEALSPDDDD
mgnify:CR=1 FL=1